MKKIVYVTDFMTLQILYIFVLYFVVITVLF